MASNNGTVATTPRDTSPASSPPPSTSAIVSTQPAPSSDSPPPPPPSSNAPPPSSNPGPTGPTLVTSTVIQSPSSSPNGPVVIVLTSSASVQTITPPPATSTSSQQTSASSSTSTTATPTNQAAGGVPQTTTIAVAVVVPLVAVALLVLAGIFFWRKRKQRKNNEELRKAEINDYSYNPNSEPPSGGMGSEDGTMKESGTGYRGWGTTSTARKMSTSVSSPPSAMARSNSGNNAPMNGSPGAEGHSGDPPANAGSPRAEPVGALGAAPIAGTRAAGVNRGPSNASSAYSGANRSEVSALSGEGAPPNHVGSPQYYADMAYPEDGAHADGGYSGQPVIQDVSARRNTRVENPSVFPQQGSAGIAQNF